MMAEIIQAVDVTEEFIRKALPKLLRLNTKKYRCPMCGSRKVRIITKILSSLDVNAYLFCEMCGYRQRIEVE